MLKSFVTQRKHDDQAIFDNTGVFDRQDVVVLKRCSGANFLPKLRQDRLSRVLRVWHLNGHSNPLDCIHRLIDSGETAGAQTTLNAVLSELLPDLQFAGRFVTVGHSSLQ